MVKQYVGARYVPKFASPVEWASNTSYEALTIVTFNNASYTSKVPVPSTVGNPANNPLYWALTGNYNAQVEQYRQETETVSNNLTTLQGQITTEITNRENVDTTLQGHITTVSNKLTTLQGNINSEASKRASADSNLQSQINQIVAPSGEAPSAAEVQNARIGADGVTYRTLGDAIRTQNSDLKSLLGKSYKNVKNILERGTASFPFVFENGGLNLMAGTDIDSPTAYRTKGKVSFGNHASVSVQYFGTKDIKMGYCWFSANGTYMSYQSTTSIRNKLVIQNSYPFYKFQFINGDGSAVTAEDMEQVLIGFDYSVDYMQAYSSLDDYFQMRDIGTAQSGVLSGSVGEAISADSSSLFSAWNYFAVGVNTGESYHIIENIYGSENIGYFFTDSNDIIVNKSISGVDSAPYIFETYVTVPTGATKLYLNYYGENKPVLLKKSIIPEGFFDLPFNFGYVAQTGLAAAISGWKPAVDANFKSYDYILVRSKPNKKYFIDGYYSGGGNQFIFEVTKDGNYLRNKVVGEDHVLAHYRDIFTLDSDAYGIVVCYRNDYDFSIQPVGSYPLKEKIIEIDSRFIETEKRIDSVEEQNDSRFIETEKRIDSIQKQQKPFDGKTAVFFGTSIPAGVVTIDGVPYSIPEYVGKLLGLTVINEAVGSSMARRGWKEKETANDPYGWTGIAWQNVFLGLGKNLSECEDLISNYDTKWKDIIGGDFAPAGQDGTGVGKPNTMVEPWITRIRESSYENKLIPYLDGTKQMPDLFIFEHGHNDVKQFDSETLTGVASVNPDNINDLDRSLFGDAMAFYIRLIKQANPQAKILIVSNYENDSSLFRRVFTSQKEVAETNKVWFCDVANVIGWSDVKKMTTTGYWSNGTSAGRWINSGGASHTITFLGAAFPDKIHPHTDLSGNAVIREAEIIANYIKSHISLD